MELLQDIEKTKLWKKHLNRTTQLINSNTQVKDSKLIPSLDLYQLQTRKDYCRRQLARAEGRLTNRLDESFSKIPETERDQAKGYI